ncbi:MAG TPA: hypothetical protein VHL58_16890 [Thermoanaerobaculia bacterium]|nr:hypothetical protein [Thermoanaerobaculia bacterium]
MFALALALRLIVWKMLGGPIIRGDARSYLNWAEGMAGGDFAGFRDYPLHQLYPLLIAPGFLMKAPLGPYLFVLQLALSMGTVALLYDAARQFTFFPAAIAAAAVAAAWPSFLLWFPYILSETSFFFFLSLFLACLTRLLARPEERRAAPVIRLLLSAALLLIARPVSIAVLAVGIPAAAYAVVAARFGRRRAGVITWAALAGALVALVVFFSMDTPLRRGVLRNPTVAQSLWLSTRLSSSSLTEWLPISAESREISDRFSSHLELAWDYKVHQAGDFIRVRPGRYVVLAARRFASYWLPGLFSDGWSAKHRIFDMLLISVLMLGTVLSLVRHRGLTPLVLFLAALSLGILTSFSQIDSDGRYRVPAELVCILLAADGYVGLVGRGEPPEGS